FLMRMTDPSFAAADAPLYLTQRDSRGYAQVMEPTAGTVPPPFTDPQKTGLPALDNLGQFITSDGKLAPSPFPAPNGGLASGARAGGGQWGDGLHLGRHVSDICQCADSQSAAAHQSGHQGEPRDADERPRGARGALGHARRRLQHITAVCAGSYEGR